MINKVEMLLSNDSKSASATSKQEAKIADSSEPSQKDYLPVLLDSPMTSLQATGSRIHQNENAVTYRATDDLDDSQKWSFGLKVVHMCGSNLVEFSYLSWIGKKLNVMRCG